MNSPKNEDKYLKSYSKSLLVFCYNKSCEDPIRKTKSTSILKRRSFFTAFFYHLVINVSFFFHYH